MGGNATREGGSSGWTNHRTHSTGQSRAVREREIAEGMGQSARAIKKAQEIMQLQSIKSAKYVQVENNVEELIAPFVVNYITKTNPKVNGCRVGVLCLKGDMSQYKLSAVYHWDYMQDVVSKKVQDERPFLIILALDEFRFQYRNKHINDKVETVVVPIVQAAIFSSAFSHCGAENRTEDYLYRLFAYVVWMMWITRRG